MRVYVSRARYFKIIKALNRANSRGNFLGNFARSFAKFFRQFESQRQGIFSELHIRRLLDHNSFQLNVVSSEQKIPNMLRQTAFQVAIQESL